MNPVFSIAKFGSEHGRRPPAAVEISPKGVLAAALPTREGPPVYALFQPLTVGTIVPGVGEPNVRQPKAVVETIRYALGQVSTRNRAVTLVLPDTVVRVFVLDFDSLPSRATEANKVLRFRLRIVVPFDFEEAAPTYQVLKANKGGCKVLAAVMPRSVFAEYEAIVRKAGYEPGAILSSTLAALESIDSQDPMLIATMSPLALTIAITHGSDLLLYRTIDLPLEPNRSLDEAQRGTAVAAACFEEKLINRPQYLYNAGSGSAAAFARWINHPEGAVVNAFRLFDASPADDIGALPFANSSIAAIAGPLAGVR